MARPGISARALSTQHYSAVARFLACRHSTQRNRRIRPSSVSSKPLDCVYWKYPILAFVDFSFRRSARNVVIPANSRGPAVSLAVFRVTTARPRLSSSRSLSVGRSDGRIGQTVAGTTRRKSGHLECALLIEGPAGGFHQGTGGYVPERSPDTSPSKRLSAPVALWQRCRRCPSTAMH